MLGIGLCEDLQICFVNIYINLMFSLLKYILDSPSKSGGYTFIVK